jgi:hypothetical protein
MFQVKCGNDIISFLLGIGMSLQQVHLRKILKIMYLQGSPRVSALRADIRADISREMGDGGGGADFYGPFWRDAKDHVFGVTDLREQTRIRIESNSGRANLYGQLRDGFLTWWDRRRRWTNQPFVPSTVLKATCVLPGINATVKFANILSVRDGHSEDHFVYPYWFPNPALNDESARLGLWALTQAFPGIDPNEIRLLDVIKGETFALERTPLRGNEQEIFTQRFNDVQNQWRILRLEYD